MEWGNHHVPLFKRHSNHVFVLRTELGCGFRIYFLRHKTGPHFTSRNFNHGYLLFTGNMIVYNLQIKNTIGGFENTDQCWSSARFFISVLVAYPFQVSYHSLALYVFGNDDRSLERKAVLYIQQHVQSFHLISNVHCPIVSFLSSVFGIYTVYQSHKNDCH